MSTRPLTATLVRLLFGLFVGIGLSSVALTLFASTPAWAAGAVSCTGAGTTGNPYVMSDTSTPGTVSVAAGIVTVDGVVINGGAAPVASCGTTAYSSSVPAVIDGGDTTAFTTDGTGGITLNGGGTTGATLEVSSASNATVAVDPGASGAGTVSVTGETGTETFQNGVGGGSGSISISGGGAGTLSVPTPTTTTSSFTTTTGTNVSVGYGTTGAAPTGLLTFSGFDTLSGASVRDDLQLPENAAVTYNGSTLTSGGYTFSGFEEVTSPSSTTASITDTDTTANTVTVNGTGPDLDSEQFSTDFTTLTGDTDATLDLPGSVAVSYNGTNFTEGIYTFSGFSAVSATTASLADTDTAASTVTVGTGPDVASTQFSSGFATLTGDAEATLQLPENAAVTYNGTTLTSGGYTFSGFEEVTSPSSTTASITDTDTTANTVTVNGTGPDLDSEQFSTDFTTLTGDTDATLDLPGSVAVSYNGTNFTEGIYTFSGFSAVSATTASLADTDTAASTVTVGTGPDVASTQFSSGFATLTGDAEATLQLPENAAVTYNGTTLTSGGYTFSGFEEVTSPSATTASLADTDTTANTVTVNGTGPDLDSEQFSTDFTTLTGDTDATLDLPGSVAVSYNGTNFTEGIYTFSGFSAVSATTASLADTDTAASTVTVGTGPDVASTQFSSGFATLTGDAEATLQLPENAAVTYNGTTLTSGGYTFSGFEEVTSPSSTTASITDTDTTANTVTVNGTGPDLDSEQFSTDFTTLTGDTDATLDLPGSVAVSYNGTNFTEGIYTFSGFSAVSATTASLADTDTAASTVTVGTGPDVASTQFSSGFATLTGDAEATLQLPENAAVTYNGTTLTSGGYTFSGFEEVTSPSSTTASITDTDTTANTVTVNGTGPDLDSEQFSTDFTTLTGDTDATLDLPGSVAVSYNGTNFTEGIYTFSGFSAVSATTASLADTDTAASTVTVGTGPDVASTQFSSGFATLTGDAEATLQLPENAAVTYNGTTLTSGGYTFSGFEEVTSPSSTTASITDTDTTANTVTVNGTGPDLDSEQFSTDFTTLTGDTDATLDLPGSVAVSYNGTNFTEGIYTFSGFSAVSATTASLADTDTAASTVTVGTGPDVASTQFSSGFATLTGDAEATLQLPENAAVTYNGTTLTSGGYTFSGFEEVTSPSSTTASITDTDTTANTVTVNGTGPDLDSEQFSTDFTTLTGDTDATLDLPGSVAVSYNGTNFTEGIYTFSGFSAVSATTASLADTDTAASTVTVGTGPDVASTQFSSGFATLTGDAEATLQLPENAAVTYNGTTLTSGGYTFSGFEEVTSPSSTTASITDTDTTANTVTVNGTGPDLDSEQFSTDFTTLTGDTDATLDLPGSVAVSYNGTNFTEGIYTFSGFSAVSATTASLADTDTAASTVTVGTGPDVASTQFSSGFATLTGDAEATLQLPENAAVTYNGTTLTSGGYTFSGFEEVTSPSSTTASITDTDTTANTVTVNGTGPDLDSEQFSTDFTTLTGDTDATLDLPGSVAVSYNGTNFTEGIYTFSGFSAVSATTASLADTDTAASTVTVGTGPDVASTQFSSGFATLTGDAEATLQLPENAAVTYNGTTLTSGGYTFSGFEEVTSPSSTTASITDTDTTANTVTVNGTGPDLDSEQFSTDFTTLTGDTDATLDLPGSVAVSYNGTNFTEGIYTFSGFSAVSATTASLADTDTAASTVTVGTGPDVASTQFSSGFATLTGDAEATLQLPENAAVTYNGTTLTSGGYTFSGFEEVTSPSSTTASITDTDTTANTVTVNGTGPDLDSEQFSTDFTTLTGNGLEEITFPASTSVLYNGTVFSGDGYTFSDFFAVDDASGTATLTVSSPSTAVDIEKTHSISGPNVASTQFSSKFSTVVATGTNDELESSSGDLTMNSGGGGSIVFQSTMFGFSGFASVSLVGDGSDTLTVSGSASGPVVLHADGSGSFVVSGTTADFSDFETIATSGSVTTISLPNTAGLTVTVTGSSVANASAAVNTTTPVTLSGFSTYQASGSTTFTTAGIPGLNFIGAGSSTLALSGNNELLCLGANLEVFSGTCAAPSLDLSFSGISTITATGTGDSAGLPAASTGAITAMTAGASVTVTGTVGGVSTTYDISGFFTLDANASGSTAFVSDGTAGYDFVGSGSGTSLSYSATPAHGTGFGFCLASGEVNLAGPTCATVGADDTFSNITTITGSPNADDFVATSGNWTLIAGSGPATIDLSSAPTSTGLTINLSGSSTSIGGLSSGSITITGFSSVIGSSYGHNTITAGAKPGILDGGGPDNTFYFTTQSTDIVNGGSGTNTIYFTGITQAITLDLSDPNFQNTGGAGTLLIVPGTIEDVFGSPGGSTIIGGASGGEITGEATSGNSDWLTAGGGTWTLNASSTSGSITTLTGGSGTHTYMNGGPGTTYFAPGTGNVTVSADSSGTSWLDFASAPSAISLNLSSSSQTVTIATSTVPASQWTTETLQPGLSGGWLAAGASPITISGAGSIANIVGSSFSDVIIAGSTAESIDTSGPATIFSGTAADTITCAPGSDCTVDYALVQSVPPDPPTNPTEYQYANQGVCVNLGQATTNSLCAQGTAVKYDYGVSDTLSGVTNVVSTSSGQDVLIAGAANQSLIGDCSQGNNCYVTMYASTAGDDTLDGGNEPNSSFFESGVMAVPNTNTPTGTGDNTYIGGQGVNTMYACLYQSSGSSATEIPADTTIYAGAPANSSSGDGSTNNIYYDSSDTLLAQGGGPIGTSSVFLTAC